MSRSINPDRGGEGGSGQSNFTVRLRFGERVSGLLVSDRITAVIPTVRNMSPGALLEPISPQRGTWAMDRVQPVLFRIAMLSRTNDVVISPLPDDGEGFLAENLYGGVNLRRFVWRVDSDADTMVQGRIGESDWNHHRRRDQEHQLGWATVAAVGLCLSIECHNNGMDVSVEISE